MLHNPSAKSESNSQACNMSCGSSSTVSQPFHVFKFEPTPRPIFTANPSGNRRKQASDMDSIKMVDYDKENIKNEKHNKDRRDTNPCLITSPGNRTIRELVENSTDDATPKIVHSTVGEDLKQPRATQGNKPQLQSLNMTKNLEMSRFIPPGIGLQDYSSFKNLPLHYNSSNSSKFSAQGHLTAFNKRHFSGTPKPSVHDIFTFNTTSAGQDVPETSTMTHITARSTVNESSGVIRPILTEAHTDHKRVASKSQTCTPAADSDKGCSLLNIDGPKFNGPSSTAGLCFEKTGRDSMGASERDTQWILNNFQDIQLEDSPPFDYQDFAVSPRASSAHLSAIAQPYRSPLASISTTRAQTGSEQASCSSTDITSGKHTFVPSVMVTGSNRNEIEMVHNKPKITFQPSTMAICQATDSSSSRQPSSTFPATASPTTNILDTPAFSSLCGPYNPNGPTFLEKLAAIEKSMSFSEKRPLSPPNTTTPSPSTMIRSGNFQPTTATTFTTTNDGFTGSTVSSVSLGAVASYNNNNNIPTTVYTALSGSSSSISDSTATSNTGVSLYPNPHYKGNPELETNQSAPIPSEQSTSLWIERLPPTLTYHELLGAIQDVGRVYASVISGPNAAHPTSAAKVVFFTRRAADRFLARYGRGGSLGYFPMGEHHRGIVVRNNILTRESERPGFVTRVLLVKGPRDVVTVEALRQLFRSKFVFQEEKVVDHGIRIISTMTSASQLGSAGIVSTGVNSESVNRAGDGFPYSTIISCPATAANSAATIVNQSPSSIVEERLIEYKFGSFRCQAEWGWKVIRMELAEKGVQVRYGWDSCDIVPEGHEPGVLARGRA